MLARPKHLASECVDELSEQVMYLTFLRGTTVVMYTPYAQECKLSKQVMHLPLTVVQVKSTIIIA